ncbi:MAG: FAD-binding protein [Proteobacteria bacterium]|nr:FAD-binding protein [Pseudomonadota bacterium]
MMLINREKCNQCELCIKSCPFGAMTITEQSAQAGDECTLCGCCVNVCPQGAIAIQRTPVSQKDLARFCGVLVVAECEERQGLLHPKKVVYELLSKGRELADKLGQTLMVIIMGDDRLADLTKLGHHGADRVLKCVHPLLKEFSTDGFTAVLSTVIADIKPGVVLYGATPNGRELAPRVAARLRLGLTADCTGLDIDAENQLVQTRPAFGGNIMAAIIAPRTRPQTATVRPNVFPVNFYDAAKIAEIREVSLVLNKSMIRTRIVQEVCLTEEQEPALEEARIIVAAGRGYQTQENLSNARRLAKKLGGVLAASRPLVEDGLLPHTRQVGQSGNTISPKLYIALGISGAVQHLVGMNGSQTIIAVNQDPKAPIFKIADLGIVGDADAVVKSLLTKLEN